LRNSIPDADAAIGRAHLRLFCLNSALPTL
jgi:hypothetical protein